MALLATMYNCGVVSDNGTCVTKFSCQYHMCQRQGAMLAVQLVLLSVVILTCLQTGVAQDSNDSKLLLQ